MADKSEKKVPSPIWQELDALCKEVSNDIASVADALKAADKQMASGQGEVWVGKNARAWGSDLHGANTDLSKQAHDFLADVQRQRASHPKEVTEAEADTERRILAGRMG
ncbi:MULTISPECIES: hypothetical protein [unclassified Streptomyces]|uniref:hypothetical protein n=1 Tax=unclassified Streptomyces TaxID=2593676 RepID=UPI002E1AEC60|nr:hypothetical protein OG217_10410 [Streptomyces sp. NBC_01023]